MLQKSKIFPADKSSALQSQICEIQTLISFCRKVAGL